MKKEIIAVVVAAVVFGGMAYVSAAKTEIKPKQEKGILIGEVIDIAGYGMFGRLGKENIEAGKYRASHGFPVGILEEETGDLWIAVYRLPVPAAGMQTANGVLTPHMGTTVVAQGVKYRTKGLNLIRLSLVGEY